MKPLALEKVKAGDIHKLNLKGIEVLEITESSWGDLRNFRIRDTVTDTLLVLTTGTYSEFTAFTLAPAKKVKKYRVTWKPQGATQEIVCNFEAKADAEAHCSLVAPELGKVEEVEVEES